MSKKRKKKYSQQGGISNNAAQSLILIGSKGTYGESTHSER